MRNVIFFACCFLPIQQAYSQSASNLYKKGDSLFKAKDYQNAAIAYSEGIRLEGTFAAVGKYWSSASAWSLAQKPDSAFYYLSFIEKSNKVTISDVKEIENDYDFAFIRHDKRWAPAIKAMYIAGVLRTNLQLSEAIKTGKRINPSVDKYEIAKNWAILKNSDSVIFYLNSIVFTDYNRYVDHATISNEKAFVFLQNDLHFLNLINEVKKNAPLFICEHKPRGERIPVKFTIDPASEFIKADRKGVFRNKEDKVTSYLLTACNLFLSSIRLMDQSGNWSDASPRYLIINLDKPVEISGAVKQGVIIDHLVEFHAFYKIDTTQKLDLIYNFNEIPIGSAVESPRTEFLFYINGKMHILNFGYWGLGDCGEPYTSARKINGKGTTMVKITRHSLTTYTIEATKGSLGRLWDIDNRTNPVDKGLFESGFTIHIENL